MLLRLYRTLSVLTSMGPLLLRSIPPWVSRDRELSFSYFESFCPAFDPFFSEGLRRARYDSPSMTKS